MSSIAVRAAREADFPAVERLTVAAYVADGQLTPGHPYERTLRDVAARAKAGDLLVAEDQSTGALVGAVLFVLPGSRYAELARPGDGELRMLAVDPAAQRRGVGEALVRACLDLAADRGCRAVVISTRDVARAAQRLYARLGFTRVPELDWSPVPGVRLLAMRLDLAGADPAGADRRASA
ncbi:MAG TPA: GNAT family N-acetyltransferase [Natronosporangium sp.]|nr:GNAT family N-acetyltransferase [Natronosporangium sp.]